MTVVLAYEITVAVPDADDADRVVRDVFAADGRVTSLERTLPRCVWCEEAEAPAYLAGDGHDPRCPFAPASSQRPDSASFVFDPKEMVAWGPFDSDEEAERFIESDKYLESWCTVTTGAAMHSHRVPIYPPAAYHGTWPKEG